MTARKWTPEQKRELDRQRAAAYRAANGDLVRERQRAARAADPEKFRAKGRANYAANRERVRELARARHRANPEKIRKANRAWQLANPEKVAAAKAAWNARNREMLTQRAAAKHAENPHIRWAQAYRARARNFGFPVVLGDFTHADVIEQYGSACFHCGGAFEELDHYPLPVSVGGPHIIENVRPACRSCNVKRKRLPAEAYRPFSPEEIAAIAAKIAERAA